MSLCAHKLSSNQYLYDTMQYCIRLCSGVLLLTKQHCLFSFVVCILLFSSICRCHRWGGVCWDSGTSSCWRRYSCHCCRHQMEKKVVGGSGLNHTLQSVGTTHACTQHTQHTMHTHQRARTHTHTHHTPSPPPLFTMSTRDFGRDLFGTPGRQS